MNDIIRTLYTAATLFAGKKSGPDFLRKFEPLTAQQFRLNIFDASEGPTINQIESLTR